MEELRGVMADRLVLTLINRRMVKPEGFHQKENGAVLMDDETRKTILTAWQSKKQETIVHPFLGEKIAGAWCLMRRRCYSRVICAAIPTGTRRFYGNKRHLHDESSNRAGCGYRFNDPNAKEILYACADHL